VCHARADAGTWNERAPRTRTKLLAVALALLAVAALHGCACQIACPPDVAPGVPAPSRPFDDRLLDFLGNLAGGAIQGSLR
jgi:hypothetical protein